MSFNKGDIVKCTGARTATNLTTGKNYVVVKDEEPGIFADRPFVTVQGDRNLPIACHASRFVIVSDDGRSRGTVEVHGTVTGTNRTGTLDT